MNPEKPRSSSALVASMGVVTILALGFAIYEFTSAKQANATLALDAITHQTDQDRLQHLAKLVKDGEAQRAEMIRALQQQRNAASASQAQMRDGRGDAPGSAAAAAAAAAAAGGSSAKVKAMEDGQAFLNAFGEQAHSMLMAIGKAQVGRNFAALAASGAISPAQMEELERQTAEQWIDSIAVTPNSIHPSDPSLPDDQVKTILGEQGFQQFQNYQRMQPLQGLVNDVSSLSTSAPLTPA